MVVIKKINSINIQTTIRKPENSITGSLIRPSKKTNYKPIIFIVSGFLLISVILIAISSISNYSKDGESDISQGKDYLTTDTSWRDYTSTKFGFTIQFPGNPTSENSSLDVQGVAVPYSSYSRYNGDIGYVVMACEYPSEFDMSDVDASLEGSLNGSVQNIKGGSLISSHYEQFKGYRAIRGIISVSVDSKIYNMYELVFIKGNTKHIFMTFDVPQSDFEKFINSFRFI